MLAQQSDIGVTEWCARPGGRRGRGSRWWRGRDGAGGEREGGQQCEMADGGLHGLRVWAIRAVLAARFCAGTSRARGRSSRPLFRVWRVCLSVFASAGRRGHHAAGETCKTCPDLARFYCLRMNKLPGKFR